MCFLAPSCAIVLLQKGARVESNIIVPASTPRDWRQYVKGPGDTKIPVWSWIPSRDVYPARQQTKFDIYEVR